LSDQDQTPYGEASTEAAQGFEKMSNAYAAPAEPTKEYGADAEGINQAARDLDDDRKRRGARDSEPTPRTYIEYGTDRHGEPAPENQTISRERAADDLTRQRAFEQAAQQPDPVAYQNAIDNFRQTFPDRELPPDLVQLVEQASAQRQATEAQHPAQPESQIQTAPEQPQVDQPHPQDGIDPEIAQALSNPKIRAALEAEVNAAEQARMQFSQATLQASRMAAAALLSQHPELASLSAQELPHAISAIEKVNPAKATEIKSQLNHAKSLYDSHLATEAQRAAIQQQQLKAWVAQEDQKFSQATAHESPEQMQKIAAAAVEVAESYGVSKQELAALWQSQPLMRSAAFQQIMADAARYHIARKEVANKVARPVPPVQRPGTGQLRTGDDYGVTSAIKSFNANPSPQNAAALLMARRAANSRR
jgi:hypothetical protein